jgi:predicted O-methyltransferase YrrM
LFKRLPQGALCVEVGSLLGDFAKEILDARPDLKLTCVDYWPGKFLGYRQGWFDKKLNAQLIEEPSALAAKKFEAHSLDLVYIDAAHNYASVIEDLSSWWPLVKSGGVLAGHDAENKPDDGFWGPIEVLSAVTSWAQKNGVKFALTTEHVCPSWYVVKP